MNILIYSYLDTSKYGYKTYMKKWQLFRNLG